MWYRTEHRLLRRLLGKFYEMRRDLRNRFRGHSLDQLVARCPPIRWRTLAVPALSCLAFAAVWRAPSAEKLASCFRGQDSGIARLPFEQASLAAANPLDFVLRLLLELEFDLSIFARRRECRFH